tara:strand:+ start:440 stop:997 length:558 start_codon:yes stop_codon:yes gene_type:complete
MNFIHCESNAYSLDSCDKLIRYFEDNISISKPGTRGSSDIGLVKDLELTLELNKQNTFWGLLSSINKGIQTYKDLYPLIDSDIDQWGLNPSCQLMKYNPNNYYDKIHCESDTYHHPIVERCFAWMLYLNDIKEGGGTEFIYQKITAKPRAGDLYIWPAYWTHMHRGVNAPNEYKYILTGWFSYRN